MKIRFLGSGAAEGIPAIFCECRLCRQAREQKRYFTRSQILIDGDLLIDFPPDSYYRALTAGVDLAEVKDILVTHSHSDHFYAEDFFMRGLLSSYRLPVHTVNVYASKAVTDLLDKFYSGYPKGTYKPEPIGTFNGYDEYAQSTEYVNVSPFEKFGAGEYTVTALPSAHVPAEPSLIYAVEKGGKRLLYATDTGYPAAEVFDFLEREGGVFDAVVYDGTYGFSDINEGHMNFRDCERMKSELAARGLTSDRTKHYITHMSHNVAKDLDDLDKNFPRGFIMACDGLEAEV